VANGKRVSTLLMLFVVLVGAPSKIFTRAVTADQGPPLQPLSFAEGKVCSGAVGGRFRDSVNVPDSYRISDCEVLAKKLVLSVARNSRGYVYELGCLTAKGYEWGDKPGDPPASNSCHWREQEGH
jgi:hypothetical protein